MHDADLSASEHARLDASDDLQGRLSNAERLVLQRLMWRASRANLNEPATRRRSATGNPSQEDMWQ